MTLSLLYRSLSAPAPPSVTGAIVAANTPNLIVEIDFTNDPSSTTRTWTDVTRWVRGTLSYVKAGRQAELQRTEAGTLNLTLDNRDGRFDPANTTSPYYPGVDRTRWVQVSAVWGGVLYYVWGGLIESFQVEWSSAGKDATVAVEASDASKILNLFDLNGHSYGVQTTGERVAAVAADVGIPVGSIDDGLSILPSVDFTSATSALSHLQEVEENETGLVFCDALGQLTFQDRHHRALFSEFASATIGDSLGGEIPYAASAIAVQYDDATIWNRVTVTPSGGTAEEATDAASVAAHFERTLGKSRLSSSQTEALAYAQYLTGLYAEPSGRLPVCSLVGRANPVYWPTIVGTEISTRFDWKRRPSTEAAARTLTIPVYVERVAGQVTVGRSWDVQFQFSPADETRYWRLAVAGYSELATTTILGF